jgi:putative endonuclease
MIGFSFMEVWFAYILYSEKIHRYYVGSTGDLELRLERHNTGWGKYTKSGIPWKIVYSEKFDSKPESLKREKEIKRKKSRKYIKGLINAGGRPE